MTANDLRARACTQARQWLGLMEADGSYRQIIDLYNWHRQPGTYKMSYADPWCACFVSAVGMAVGLGDVLLPHVNCDGMIAAYKAAGRWVEDDGYLPSPGDVVFYDWQDDGRGDNRGSSDHVGLVAEVDGSDILVIEGNMSDSVGTRKLHRDGRYIRGYAVPDYEAAADGAAQTQQEAESAAPAQQTGAAILDRPDGAVVMADDTGSGLTVNPEPDNYIDTSRVTVPLPVLRYGDGINNPSEAVKAAQLLLVGRGYRCGPWGADGEFGAATHGGVFSFQRDRRLTPDGVIGAETWRMLLGI